MDLVKEMIPAETDNFFWHVISVEELEFLLDLPGENLFEKLESKRLDENWRTRDFRDYMAHRYSESPRINRCLESIERDFFEEYGLPSVEQISKSADSYSCQPLISHASSVITEISLTMPKHSRKVSGPIG
jgi:hypothetical protein